MEPDDVADAYRRRLLASLQVVPGRDHDEEPGSLQIFVNHECVGAMECDEASHAVASITQPRAIQTVEIRTASGRLIGSLCAQDLRMKMARLPVGDHVLEISIHNRVDGGSVQVAYHVAKLVSKQARPNVKEGYAKMSPASVAATRSGVPQSVWSSAAMVGRAGFAVAILFLVADRLSDRVGSPPRTEPAASPVASLPYEAAVSEKAMARQEEILIKVMQGQEAALRTMQAQQHVLARAHQAIEGLTQGQSHLTARVSRVSLQMAQLDETARVGRAELAGLAGLAGIDMRGKVERGAKQATVTLAQAMLSDLSGAIPAKVTELTTLSPGSFPGITESSRNLPTLAPFTFWVSFQDNTPEKSIQDLIQEIHGRTGQTSAGWYHVEVDLPQPQTPDLFVDALKKMTIVKSVTTSLKTTSVR
ncbi:MAG: hypothetical protein M3Z35_01770 [Nitrospirota bacterium]|nr:hypothetical protein [Nitrospirota bacterium]